MLSCEAFIAHNYCDVQFLFTHPPTGSPSKKAFFSFSCFKLAQWDENAASCFNWKCFFPPELCFNYQRNFILCSKQFLFWDFFIPQQFTKCLIRPIKLKSRLPRLRWTIFFSQMSLQVSRRVSWRKLKSSFWCAHLVSCFNCSCNSTRIYQSTKSFQFFAVINLFLLRSQVAQKDCKMFTFIKTRHEKLDTFFLHFCHSFLWWIS